jgi:hypothetical protein
METKSKQEQVVEHMLALRDARAALKSKFEDEDKKLREQYDRGEAWLMGELQASGAAGLRFDCATVSQTTTMQANIGDWGALSRFIVENNEVDLLQHRVSTTALKAYLESSGDKVPPGINVVNTRGITIHRKS